MSDESPHDAAHWEAVEEAVELLHESRWQDALYALRDALKANPSNAYAFFFLGHALFELGQIEPARDAYRAAVKLAPNYLGARVALAEVLRMLGDVREAIAEGEIALRKAPDDPDALHALGMAHAEQGDRNAAKKYLERYLATNPEYEAATEVRGVLEELSGGGEPDDD